MHRETQQFYKRSPTGKSTFHEDREPISQVNLCNHANITKHCKKYTAVRSQNETHSQEQSVTRCSHCLLVP